MAKKNKRKHKSAESKGAVARQSSTLAHDLEDLLRTVRRISHYEDDLCVLTEAAKKAEEVDAELFSELSGLLRSMSAFDYNKEVNALLSSLPQADESTSSPEVKANLAAQKKKAKKNSKSASGKAGKKKSKAK